MRRLATVLVATLLAAAVASCGGDDDPTVEVPTGADVTTTSGGATTTSGAGATQPASDRDDAADDKPFSTQDVTIAAAGGYGLLTELRHARHDGFYRVVFQFDGDVPGVKVGYTERPVVQDGSGDEIGVAGDEVLLVQFEPASGFDMKAAEESYTGPKRLEVEQAPVVEIVRVSDFEAHLDWAIGVDTDTGFRVSTLTNPSRVVIDLEPVVDA